jgi:hypothetical protein
MEKIPFTIYDFFAYLSSGGVWVLTADYVLAFGLLDREKITPMLAVLLIIFAYVCGHIVAHFSSLILEQTVVARLLRRPNSVLMGEHARSRFFKWVFPGYFRALPQPTQRRVVAQAEARGAQTTGEALFLHAYPIVTANGALQARLDDFRNQYGFARNMSFAFLTSMVAILVAHHLGYHPVGFRWALLSGLAGIALFYRYLKFFRQFSYELFLRYAELPPAAAT